jgi:hypothetical protein
VYYHTQNGKWMGLSVHFQDKWMDTTIHRRVSGWVYQGIDGVNVCVLPYTEG